LRECCLACKRCGVNCQVRNWELCLECSRGDDDGCLPEGNQDDSPIQPAAIRGAWEQCKQYGLNEETIHFMDNALDGAGY
jgi:hypothetical protein